MECCFAWLRIGDVRDGPMAYRSGMEAEPEDLSSGLPAALPVSKAAPKAEPKGPPLDVAEEDAGPSVAVPAVKAATADPKGAPEEESLLGDGDAPKTNVEGPKAVKDEAGWQEVVQAASDAARAAWFPPDEVPRAAAESVSLEVAKDAVRHRKTGEEIGLAVNATIRAAGAMPAMQSCGTFHRQASACGAAASPAQSAAPLQACGTLHSRPSMSGAAAFQAQGVDEMEEQRLQLLRREAYRVLRGHGPSGAPEFDIVTTQQLG